MSEQSLDLFNSEKTTSKLSSFNLVPWQISQSSDFVIGNIASARQIELTSVETTVEGDIDMQGILGLNDNVRNGYNGIRASFKIAGNATAEKLHQIVEQSMARSAVLDVLTNGVKVDVDIAT